MPSSKEVRSEPSSVFSVAKREMSTTSTAYVEVQGRPTAGTNAASSVERVGVMGGQGRGIKLMIWREMDSSQQSKNA
jgi:hypothetical protein